MATTVPWILKGNLMAGATGPGIDVSDQILALQIMGDRDIIEVPPTLATPKSRRAGGSGYSVRVDFLSAAGDAADFWRICWEALDDPDGTIYLAGTILEAAVSATNPQFIMEAIVIGASLGGDAEGLSRDSRTFPLTGRPTEDTTP